MIQTNHFGLISRKCVGFEPALFLFQAGVDACDMNL